MEIPFSEPLSPERLDEERLKAIKAATVRIRVQSDDRATIFSGTHIGDGLFATAKHSFECYASYYGGVESDSDTNSIINARAFPDDDISVIQIEGANDLPEIIPTDSQAELSDGDSLWVIAARDDDKRIYRARYVGPYGKYLPDTHLPPPSEIGLPISTKNIFIIQSGIDSETTPNFAVKRDSGAGVFNRKGDLVGVLSGHLKLSPDEETTAPFGGECDLVTFSSVAAVLRQKIQFELGSAPKQ